ncbi:hypothetical protein AB2B38_000560 [Balneola sp. MJW-20]|uniref:hypothetical protein n=1 Tax=Gracilimonas aurantiaca TaxID=3234185 RepID=UPI0034675964
MSFAIYEILGFVLALPLSYAMAYLARKYSKQTYKDEMDRLFSAYWSGKEEDAMYAWLRVRQLLSSRRDEKKIRYIDKKISELNKNEIYGSSSVNEKGEVV